MHRAALLRGCDGLRIFRFAIRAVDRKGAPAIPEEAKTIRYLKEHTKNGEKIVGKDVELPVDSGMFYGLRDIRGHGFLMTEPKVRAFYTAIDDSAYSNFHEYDVISVKNEDML